MAPWVLILIVLMPNRIAQFDIEFASQILCNTAGQAIRREFERDTYGRPPGVVQYICVRAGD